MLGSVGALGLEPHMKRTAIVALLLTVIAPCSGFTQSASAVVDAATKATGTSALQPIRYAGRGTNNGPGQAFTSGGPWPRVEVTQDVALVERVAHVHGGVDARQLVLGAAGR